MTNGVCASCPSYSSASASYELSEFVLGEGSNSTVYVGCNVSTGEPVALKIVDKSVLTVEESVQLKRESQLLNKIKHFPHSDDFVRLLDVIEKEDELCLVTELVEGGDLHDYCSSFASGVPERIGKWIFHKVLSTVDHLHQQDICHLDLKLENIMYNKETRKAKLIDFGFASETSEVLTDGSKVDKLQTSYCGSIHYAAPEIVKRTPYNGKSADVWSLGILLFVLLSGLFPFDDSRCRVEFIFDKIAAGSFFTPRHLSTDASDLLQSILQSDPNKRPTVSQILKHPWFAAVSKS